MVTLHESLIHTHCRLVVSAAGGGVDLLSALWREPGASSYLVGAVTPYAQTQIESFLGYALSGSACSMETAIDMASSSYAAACEHCALVSDRAHSLPIGLAITASVASTRIPRGHQRAHVCLISPNDVRHRELRFEKAIGRDARREQDRQITQACSELLEAVLLGNDFGDDVESEALERLFHLPVFTANGRRMRASAGHGSCYLPATLNPLHDGHREMARQSDAELGMPGHTRFLVTSTPVHKQRLRLGSLLERLGQVRADRARDEPRCIEFSRDDPLFLDKVRQRPHATFVIGVDTLVRLLDPRWGHATRSVLEALDAAGARFHVMGRLVDERFMRLRDVGIPETHAHLFTEIAGRIDQSSTALRDREPMP